MAQKPIWKRLKYKNIAVVLIALVLVIVIISSACSRLAGSLDKKNKEKNNSKNSSNISVEDSGNQSKDPNATLNENTLDKNYRYESISNDDHLYSGDLLLINSEFAYKSGTPSEMESSYDYRVDTDGNRIMSIKDSSVTAKKVVLQNLNRMLSDLRKAKDISDVMLVSGYRTEEYQKTLYDNNLASTGLDYSTTIEIPGHSEHHSGYAVDFQLDQTNYPIFSGTGDYSWVVDNCYKYGFILRYQSDKSGITGIDNESWHYRYVGVPHAQIIYNDKLCLEEYITHIKQYTREKPYYLNSDDGTRYAIYYVAKNEGDSTNVDIPLFDNGAEYDYSISGNNCDGFIVTINISTGQVEKTAE
ncbi:MAG: M15 family metallopeptidase [Clostridiales bacterium]|nr:M15 family metallopeptidase [Clostridiales bacterium]